MGLSETGALPHLHQPSCSQVCWANQFREFSQKKSNAIKEMDQVFVGLLPELGCHMANQHWDRGSQLWKAELGSDELRLWENHSQFAPFCEAKSHSMQWLGSWSWSQGDLKLMQSWTQYGASKENKAHDEITKKKKKMKQNKTKQSKSKQNKKHLHCSNWRFLN